MSESSRNVDAVGEAVESPRPSTRVSEEMKQCAGGTHYKVASQAMLATWAEAVARLEQEREELKAKLAPVKRCLDCEKPVEDARFDLCEACDDALSPVRLEDLPLVWQDEIKALRARAEHAEAELQQLRGDAAYFDNKMVQAEADRDFHREQADRWRRKWAEADVAHAAERDRLNDYVQHRYDCGVQNTDKEPICSCGLSALLSSPSVKEP